jgi:hypothetical protein
MRVVGDERRAITDCEDFRGDSLSPHFAKPVDIDGYLGEIPAIITSTKRTWSLFLAIRRTVLGQSTIFGVETLFEQAMLLFKNMLT